MINPNKTHYKVGKVLSVETFTSMIVYKIEVEGATLDYTVFGDRSDTLVSNDRLNVIIAYSVVSNAYYIKSVEHKLKLVA